MTLRERLNADLTTAMRAGDGPRRDTLRLLLAAIKQAEVDQQTTLDEGEIAALLAKQAKQRRESIADYEKGGRASLAAQEYAELEIIKVYLPQMMDRAAVTAIAAEVIAELGVSDAQSMGRVMGQLMPRLKGQADGRLVNEVVRELLTTS